MADRFGATEDRWRHYMALGLTADLLPCISNPNATISPHSRMKVLGKTPSRYNQERQAVGIAEWTSLRSTGADIERWAKEPDLGICIQTRRLRAIDVDVEDEALSRKVMLALRAHLSADPLVRVRKASGKCLIPFWYIDGPLPKHVIPVEGGMIEILGDGQQFIAEGFHKSGSRYEWLGEDIPVLDADDFALLLEALTEIATGPVRIARQRRELNGAKPLNLQDDVAEWLVDNWEIYDAEEDGRLYLACPFADEHSADSGATACAYFPAGSGGYSDGAFCCLHAHCTGREQAEFLNACGFVAGQFVDLGAGDSTTEDVVPDLDGAADNNQLGAPSSALPAPAEARHLRQALIATERWPKLTRAKDQKIEPTMNNLLAALKTASMVKRHIAHDDFKEEIVWAEIDKPFDLAEWQPFRDSDYARIRQELEVRGFKPFGAELLRLAVLTTAEEHRIDCAQAWLGRLRWDGTPRLEQFAARGWGWLDNPYSAAVGRYVWTALAGRVLQPGCQADMTPVLIGEQGARKTSAIKAMVPDPECYLTVKLDAHDDDTARRLRGKMVVELEELRGINTRSIEEIKAWLTRTREEWVPKWREFSTKYYRRNLFFGSGNENEFLADPTGERRWLPGLCGVIDVDWIADNRDQLWAEGAVMFRLDGIDWQDAERLAREQHGEFKISDAWEPYVLRWLEEDQLRGAPSGWAYVTTGDALTGALGLAVHAIDLKRQSKMAKVLRGLGYRHVRLREGSRLVNGFVKEK